MIAKKGFDMRKDWGIINEHIGSDMLRLFHVGFQIIEKPDIGVGRRNADFAQGFYLSSDEEFSRRWARERKDSKTYLNTYVLNLEGLRVKVFERNAEWFEYIFSNRAGHPDVLDSYDVLTGPIANDTIYDTWGIVTSGLLEKETALRILEIGPAYNQTVIKTLKAVKALTFCGASVIGNEEIDSYRSAVEIEEKNFQEQMAKILESSDP